MGSRCKASATSGRRASPSDAELIAHVTSPMRSFDVARHFGMDGPICLRRLAKLVRKGALVRPYYGFYAPPGTNGPRPLPPLHCEVLAVLDQPRSAAEVSALVGVSYSVTHVLQTMIECGHVAHCGRYFYVRADLADRFPPRRNRPRPASGARASPEDMKQAIIRELVEPRSITELVRALGEHRERVAWHVEALVKEGALVRVIVSGQRSGVRYRLSSVPEAPASERLDRSP